MNMLVVKLLIVGSLVGRTVTAMATYTHKMHPLIKYTPRQIISYCFVAAAGCLETYPKIAKDHSCTNIQEVQEKEGNSLRQVHLQKNGMWLEGVVNHHRKN